MEILFKKWSGPLLLPRDARWEETFCALYRDRDMACAAQGQLMASMCWPYVSQHHELGRNSKRVSVIEDKYLREIEACELFGYLCTKIMIMFCTKAEPIIICFTFPKLPTNPLIFWLEELPVGIPQQRKSGKGSGKLPVKSVSPSCRDGLKCSRWRAAPGIHLMIMPSSRQITSNPKPFWIHLIP